MTGDAVIGDATDPVLEGERLARLEAWMDAEGLPGAGSPLTTRFLSGGSQNEIFELRRDGFHAAMRIPPATVTNIIDWLENDKLVRRVPHPSDARTTLAVITAKGRKTAENATEELNTSVYERIGLSEDQRRQLTDLLAQLRASGNEFDVERSQEVIAEVGSRQGNREDVA